MTNKADKDIVSSKQKDTIVEDKLSILGSKLTVKDFDKDMIMELSNGVVLGLTMLNSTAIMRRQVKHNRRKPSSSDVKYSYYDTKRKENVFNPDSPLWESDNRDHELESTQRLIDYAIVKGVDILEIPEDVPHIDGQEWLDELESTGEDVPETLVEKKLMWIYEEAFPSMDEFNRFIKEIGRLIGISEADVEKK